MLDFGDNHPLTRNATDNSLVLHDASRLSRNRGWLDPASHTDGVKSPRDVHQQWTSSSCEEEGVT